MQNSEVWRVWRQATSQPASQPASRRLPGGWASQLASWPAAQPPSQPASLAIQPTSQPASAQTLLPIKDIFLTPGYTYKAKTTHATNYFNPNSYYTTKGSCTSKP